MEIDKDKESSIVETVDKDIWLAGRVLTTYANTAEINRLQLDMNAATKIRLGENLLKSLKSFCSLNEEDLSEVIEESAFPSSNLWVEWEADNKFLCMWDRLNTNNIAAGHMGALIKASPDGKTGVVQYISGEENIFIMPIALLFDWNKNYKLPEENMEKLRQSLSKEKSLQGNKLKDKRLEDLLNVKSRFGYEDSAYISLDEEKKKAMQPVLDSAFEYIIDSEIFLMGTANLLPCCNIEDWKTAELMIN